MKNAYKSAETQKQIQKDKPNSSVILNSAQNFATVVGALATTEIPRLNFTPEGQ